MIQLQTIAIWYFRRNFSLGHALTTNLLRCMITFIIINFFFVSMSYVMLFPLSYIGRH